MIERDPNYRAASAYEYGDVREFTLKAIVNTEILWSCGYVSHGEHYGIAGCTGPFEALAHVLQEAEQKAASPMPDYGSLSKTAVLEALNRLNRQYDDNKRATIRNIRGYDDLHLLSVNAGVASRWEAKQDAVKMVADDLGVVLEQLDKEQEA